MKAASFEYVRAGSLEEACAVLAQHGDAAKLIAGGQSLVPMMAMRLSRPSLLVNINEIDALKFVAAGDEWVRIGACTRQCVLERDAALAARVPLIRQALAWVGHIQTRNRGTLGGSLVHADPAAELPVVAQVLEARMTLRSVRGERTIDAHDFFTGPMMSALDPDECLHEIAWPVWPERRIGSSFQEVSIRHGDFALVAAGAQVALGNAGQCVRATFGLGGVEQTPLAFPDLAAGLIGTKLEDDAIRDVAQTAAAAIEPVNDLHATETYRRHLARVLVERVLRTAREAATQTKIGQLQ